MVNPVARALEQTVFVVEETTKGVLVFPTAADELVACAGDANINQQPAFSNSDEIINSLDIINRFQDQAGPGTFSLPTYVHPSGTPGSIPMSSKLFKSLMGIETISGGVSVVYSQALLKPSVSIWIQKGHTVFFARGACVDMGKENATNKGGTGFDFSGGFMEMGWAGTDAVVGDVSADTDVIVTNHKLFKVGARVQLAADNNSNAGYEIESINTETNTLTMTEVVTVVDGAVIKGFVPTGFTVIGNPLENRKTTIEIDAVARDLKSVSIDIGSPVQYQTDEITQTNFPEEYVEDRRAISGTIEQLLKQSDVQSFYDGYADKQVGINIIVGDSAGDIFKTSLPFSKLEVPNITSTAPTVSMSTPFTALGSVGEDSCSLTFT